MSASVDEEEEAKWSPSNEDDILKSMEETSMADLAMSDTSNMGSNVKLGGSLKGSFAIFESWGSFPSK